MYKRQPRHGAHPVAAAAHGAELLTIGNQVLGAGKQHHTPQLLRQRCGQPGGRFGGGQTVYPVLAAAKAQQGGGLPGVHPHNGGLHLLQKALREVLGEHVHQAGSYQDDQITHFDFTHFSAVSPAELAEVERRVNEKIYEALPVTVKNLPIEEAKKMGAMALFGEKYGSVVRVVDAGGWSTEFCGGTHVTNTAQIGCFKILSESSVAAGIRRIEATTAFGVLNLLDDRTEILAKTAVALKANNLKDAPARAEALAAELKETAKQLEILKAQMAAAKIDGLFENAADIDGVRIVSAYLTGTGADTLRDMVDKVRDKAPNAVTVLIGSDGNKTMMAVGVSKNALARGLKAGALVKKIAAIAGGNGGGKPDFAMAGIRDTSKIDDALNAVPEIVKAEMNQ